MDVDIDAETTPLTQEEETFMVFLSLTSSVLGRYFRTSQGTLVDTDPDDPTDPQDWVSEAWNLEGQKWGPIW